MSIDHTRPPCQKCHTNRTEMRRNSNDFRCKDCNRVFRPDQNPFPTNTISWFICEELFEKEGSLKGIAARVMVKLPEGLTTNHHAYFRTSQVIRIMKDSHYEVIKTKTKDDDDVWFAKRGMSAQQAFQEASERGRWASRLREKEVK